MSAIVLDKSGTEGQPIRYWAYPGETPVFDFSGMKDDCRVKGIEVVADFLSTDAVRIQPGAPVLIEGWGGSHPLKGRVRLVEPAGFMKVSALGVEEQRVNVLIDFDDTAAAGRLGDAYRVEVRVVVWQEDDVLKVPVGGVFRRGNDWAAFVIDGFAVKAVAIEPLLATNSDRDTANRMITSIRRDVQVGR